MFRCIVLLVGGLASLCAASLFAQDAVVGQQYGSGVHAYFSGDYVAAQSLLTAAIDGGSKDPRAFYFRGLAYLKLGRGPEATRDFRKGASLESQDEKFYNVSKALERVQGAARAELEKHRIEARTAALERTERFRKARYEAIQREESRVLREMPPAAPKPIETSKPIVEKADKPAAEPAAADPFATPPVKPVKSGAAAKPTEEEKGPAKEERPAVETKPADAADPFQEEPAAEEKKPAAEEKMPAAEEKKPAAEEKPAEKKADSDDPFAQ
jgi:hypothetical protein